ncbi:MAG: molybdopterin converting factor subunit 1 [Bacteroidetes bacterium]|jgi:molybdopterin converting factor subunit 1|nr:molybdopterin converting factor subunit 1 [Bacteroidota bacterium]
MKVLIFGAARDIIGKRELDFPLPTNPSVKSFRENIFKEFPELKKLNALAFAVNEEYANDDDVLKNQDVVALIPPVSGG